MALLTMSVLNLNIPEMFLKSASIGVSFLSHKKAQKPQKLNLCLLCLFVANFANRRRVLCKVGPLRSAHRVSFASGLAPPRTDRDRRQVRSEVCQHHLRISGKRGVIDPGVLSL